MGGGGVPHPAPFPCKPSSCVCADQKLRDARVGGRGASASGNGSCCRGQALPPFPSDLQSVHPLSGLQPLARVLIPPEACWAASGSVTCPQSPVHFLRASRRGLGAPTEASMDSGGHTQPLSGGRDSLDPSSLQGRGLASTAGACGSRVLPSQLEI